MSTSKGYTGQRLDGSAGLLYYDARYCDAAARSFTSADTASDGLNRYAYLHVGNPETYTDPMGHRIVAFDWPDGGGGTSGSG